MNSSSKVVLNLIVGFTLFASTASPLSAEENHKDAWRANIGVGTGEFWSQLTQSETLHDQIFCFQAVRTFENVIKGPPD